MDAYVLEEKQAYTWTEEGQENTIQLDFINHERERAGYTHYRAIPEHLLRFVPRGCVRFIVGHETVPFSALTRILETRQAVLV